MIIWRGKTSEFERAKTIVFDDVSGSTIEVVKEEPVLINYTFGGKKFDKEPDADDLSLLERIQEMPVKEWFPTDSIPDGFNTNQPKKSHLITRIDLNNSQNSSNKKQNRSNIRAKNQKIVNNTKPRKIIDSTRFFHVKSSFLFHLSRRETTELFLKKIYNLSLSIVLERRLGRNLGKRLG